MSEFEKVSGFDSVSTATMRTRISPKDKVLALISYPALLNHVRTEVGKYGAEIEECLFMQRYCRIALMDFFYFQLGAADSLQDGDRAKKVFLILTQPQMYSSGIEANGSLHDILVVLSLKEGGVDGLVSARRGEVTIQGLLEKDGPELSPANRIPGKGFVFSERN